MSFTNPWGSCWSQLESSWVCVEGDPHRVRGRSLVRPPAHWEGFSVFWRADCRSALARDPCGEHRLLQERIQSAHVGDVGGECCCDS